MKETIILMLIMMSFGLLAVTNQDILKNLDYNVDSKFSEKTEINDFADYYNLSVIQANIYKRYLNSVGSSLRDLDSYLNFLTKKDLFLEKFKPLNILDFDKYSDIEEYQRDLFKIIKKKEIDRIMNLDSDYRKLFISMIESSEEMNFWQNVILKEGVLYDYLEKDYNTKNNFYKENVEKFTEQEIKAVGGIEKHIVLIKSKIDKIMKSGSSGGSKPRDKTMPIPDNWSEGDRIRLSNYFEEIFSDLQAGDIFLVENGNGNEFAVGYYDHATMLNSHIQYIKENHIKPHGGQHIFISSWGGTGGVTTVQRYIYQYVYRSIITDDDYDEKYERIRKRGHKVLWGRIDTSYEHRLHAATYAESKVGHDYGISATCDYWNNNYTCSGLLYCAYKSQGVDIDGVSNGAVYPDDIEESDNFIAIKKIDYDNWYSRAKFSCPEPITNANAFLKSKYDFAEWNFNCPVHGTVKCQEDYNECYSNGGKVYSAIGYEGDCSWESCGHTDAACESPLYWGEFNRNGFNEYILANLQSFIDESTISVCAENLISKNDFPLIQLASCMGPNITGGNEDQDYVNVMHENCTQEMIDEWCPEGVTGLSAMYCMMKVTECGAYAQTIKERCPYLYNIRTYGCDVDYTDGLSDLLNDYKEKNCKNISPDNEVTYRACGKLSYKITELCPEYINGDYETW